MTHTHTCTTCRATWAHNPPETRSKAQNDAWHICPACGGKPQTTVHGGYVISGFGALNVSSMAQGAGIAAMVLLAALAFSKRG